MTLFVHQSETEILSGAVHVSGHDSWRHFRKDASWGCTGNVEVNLRAEYVREIPGSNLDQVTGYYDWYFLSFTQSPG